MKSVIDTFLSAIVYVSAENHENMLGMVPKLIASLKKNFRSFEVILVNDSKSAFTQEDIEWLKSSNPDNLVLLDLAYCHGMERAMTAGADLSVGDFVIEFDYPIANFHEDLPKELYHASTEMSADIVGIMPANAMRKESSFFYRMLKYLGTTEEVLQTESVRIVSRRVLNRVLKDRNSIRFRKISYALSGFKYKTIIRSDLVSVQCKKSRARLGLAIDILSSFSRIGSSLSRGFSLLFALFSLILGIYAVAIRLIGLPVSEGWTTLMLFMALGFLGIFSVLYTLSRMLEIVLLEIQNASPYTVREVVRIDNM